MNKTTGCVSRLKQLSRPKNVILGLFLQIMHLTHGELIAILEFGMS